MVQKCIPKSMKSSPTRGSIRERAGAFSAVTGGRAPEKTSPGALGTKEKVPALSRDGLAIRTLLNVS
jgi:hypothetical protein